MKTAISIPDDVFEAADALAERIGMSRSRLYATAVAEYLAKHWDTDVTRRLDAVYATEAAGVEQPVRATQARSVNGREW